MSGIKRWDRAFVRKIFLSKEDAQVKQVTHRLLDRGNLHVEWGKDLKTFQRKYAVDLYRGIDNFICELKTPVFKFFMDLDIYDKEQTLEYPAVFQWIKVIQSVVGDFFGYEMDDYARRVMVLTTDPQSDVKHGDGFYTKIGVHLVWQEVAVDGKAAQLLRKAIIQKLTNIYGERPSYNRWSEVIDDCVYNTNNGNGLRMVGSAKWKRCDSCKGKRSFDGYCKLNVCMGEGGYNIGRKYEIRDIVDGGGRPLSDEKQKYVEDELELIADSSIRSQLTAMPLPLTNNPPEWFDLAAYEANERLHDPVLAKKRNKFYKDRSQLTPDDRAGTARLGISNRTLVQPGSKIYSRIKKLINTKMPDIYKGTEIMDIHKIDGNDAATPTKSGSFYYAVRTNSSFCMNVSREHNSNTIYFLINEHGIYQKCFCRCDKLEGRKFGKCATYCSSRYEMGISDTNILFPSRDRTLDTPFVDALCKLSHHNPGMLQHKFPRLLERKQSELLQLYDEIILGKTAHERKFNVQQ